MSQDQNPIEIAKQAERDLNSQAAKGNLRSSKDENEDPSIDESKFPGATVQVDRTRDEIPLDEGGEILRETGQTTKARDFEGVGGPEDKARIAVETRGGDDDIRENVRQGGETRRP